MQAAIGYPMTVHGTGGQTRAFIHIQDTVRCIELAIENPPQKGERVRILNARKTPRTIFMSKTGNCSGLGLSRSRWKTVSSTR